MLEVIVIVQLLLTCIITKSLGISSNTYHHVTTGSKHTSCFSNNDQGIPNRYASKQYKVSNNDSLNVRIESIQKFCGELCYISKSKITNTNTTFKPSEKKDGLNNGFFESITKTVDCKILWGNTVIDNSGSFCIPPRTISKFMEQLFTHDGQLDIQYSYYNDVPSINIDMRNELKKYWNIGGKYGLKSQLRRLESQILQGNYGYPVVKRMQKMIQQWMSVKNKHVLVIGSTTPWIEVILLSEEVGNITTLEYNPHHSDHPKINVVSPMDISELFSKEKSPMFDAMITFSSIEHSGLGRYGDQLNPWGDIIAMGRAWCLMKPGGRALVGVPTAKDKICFNSHRYYGKILYKHIFSNWNVLHSEVEPKKLSHDADCKNPVDFNYQPMTVLEKSVNVL